ncbi:hypothetical protein [Methanopyrus sp. SNP6]|uniref:hypothetical protein n=1 Tax=Methanopyrus sp. SNP6 TaxID=1937005 RepID=UPI0011E5E8D5|nr:hypothetical protein [Methanopyrus sp. SNP6]
MGGDDGGKFHDVNDDGKGDDLFDLSEIDDGSDDGLEVPDIELDGESDGSDQHSGGSDPDHQTDHADHENGIENILSYDDTDVDVSNTNVSTAKSGLDADLDSNSESFSESSSESNATQYNDQHQDLDFDQSTEQVQDSTSESVSDVENVSESNPDVDMNVVDDDPSGNVNIEDIDVSEENEVINEIVNDNDSYYYVDEDHYLDDPSSGSPTSDAWNFGSVDPPSDPSASDLTTLVLGPEDDPYMVVDTQEGQVDLLVGDDPTTIDMDQSELSQLLDLVNWLDGNVPSDILDLLYQILAYLLEIFYGILPLDQILGWVQQISEYALSGELDSDALGQMLDVLETATSPLQAVTGLTSFLGDLGSSLLDIF